MDTTEGTWAEVFKEAYEAQGFGSDEEAAYKLGVSLRTIQNYKAGRTSPRLGDLQRIAPALDLEVTVRVRPKSKLRSRAASGHIREYLVPVPDLQEGATPRPFDSPSRGIAPVGGPPKVRLLAAVGS